MLLVSCGHTGKKVWENAEGQLVIVFDEKAASAFFTDSTFRKVELTLLETTDDCLVGRYPSLLSDNHHFFIKDQQQQVIFRFDKSGKFINTIGRRGMGTAEYTDLSTCYLDSNTDEVEVTTEYGQILKYNYDGSFISSFNPGINAVSYIKIGTDYLFNIGVIKEAADGQLIKISEDGTVVEKFLPVKTSWQLPFGIAPCFSQCGTITTFKEYLSHIVYHITDHGPVKALIFDFGTYAIPNNIFEKDFEVVRNELGDKRLAFINKFFENERFVYVFFFLPNDDDVFENYHWLINKNTGNSVLQKFLPDDPLHSMLEIAQLLTADNELIFLANAQLLKETTNPFFSNHIQNIANAITDDSNPVIISLKINNF